MRALHVVTVLIGVTVTLWYRYRLVITVRLGSTSTSWKRPREQRRG